MTRTKILGLLTAAMLLLAPAAAAQGGFPSVPGMGASGRAVPEQSRPKPRAQAVPPENPTGNGATQAPAATASATRAPTPTTRPQAEAPRADPAPVVEEENDLPVSGAPIQFLVLIGGGLALAGVALTGAARLARRLRPA
jgi:hypothetical protein